MASHPPSSSSSSPGSPFRTHAVQRIGATLLCLLLVSSFLTTMPIIASTAFAAGLGTPPAAHLTLKQFLAQGRPDKVYRGPLLRPTTDLSLWQHSWHASRSQWQYRRR